MGFIEREIGEYSWMKEESDLMQIPKLPYYRQTEIHIPTTTKYYLPEETLLANALSLDLSILFYSVA